MVESNRPNVHLYEFRNGQLRAVAAGPRGSYSSIARDYNGSYSSAAPGTGWKVTAKATVLQQWFVGQYSRPGARHMSRKSLFLDIPPDVDMSTLSKYPYLGPDAVGLIRVKEGCSYGRPFFAVVPGREAEVDTCRGQSPQEVKRQRLRETEFLTGKTGWRVRP